MTKWILVTTITLSWQLVFSGANFSTTQPRDIMLRFGNTLEEILQHWKLKNLVGQDEYQVHKGEKGNILQIYSEKSASLLYKKIDFDVKEYGVIRWHWLVNKFPEYADHREKYTIDDYAARLCVVFPSWTVWSTRFLVYVWDDRATGEGIVKPSSFSKNCKILVVEGGQDNKGKWVTEERNIIEDYKKVFGNSPDRNAGGIGIMSDSDDTKTSTNACYYNIYLKSDS